MTKKGRDTNMLHMENKKVLFITTKNLDYLRNVQEMKLLRQEAKNVDVLGYKDRSYAKRLFKIYFHLLFRNFKGYDGVFIGFAPQLILPLFSWKMHNKQIVMDFFISVYDTMVFDRKKIKVNSVLAKICKWLDKTCIHKADYIISDTNAHGDYFSTEFGVERNKITTLYLEADNMIYSYKESDKPEKLKEKFVVLYFGSILPLQGVEVIINAIKILKNQKDVFFYVIGPIGNDVPCFQNVEFIKWLPQEELAQYIANADLCLAGHFNGMINKAKRTIPGKAYIYEAMRKPMILGDNAATRELFYEDANHYFVEMGSAEKLAEIILKVKENIGDKRLCEQDVEK